MYRLVPSDGGSQYAAGRKPLLDMSTEFADLASANLRMLADRIDREDVALTYEGPYEKVDG